MAKDTIAMPVDGTSAHVGIQPSQNHVDSAGWDKIRHLSEESQAWELSLSNWQTLKVFKKASFWSFIASLSIVMEGYDTALTGGMWGMPAFRRYFGDYLPDKEEWQVSASWQAGIGQASTVSNYIGIPLAAWMVERYGYRKTLIINYLMILPFIAITTFAQNKVMLLIGAFLCGIPWGAFSTVAETYASEVCPIKLRGILTGWVNVCWVIGIFLSNGVLTAVQGGTSQWAFRIPYACQWVWPIPLLVAMYLAPESPWWLVRHGEVAEAERNAARLSSPEQRHRVKEMVAMMIRTDNLEQEEGQDSGSWLDIFKGVDLRRTEITCMAWACQNLSGCPFGSSTIYFFQQAGISDSTAYKLGFGNSAVMLVANIVGLWLISRVGRRTLYLTGLSSSAALMLVIGGLGVASDRGSSGSKWGSAAIIYVWNLLYTLCLGPVAYSVVGEVSSTRLRNKTVGLSRLTYQAFGITAGVINPYMLNPGAWNWAGKTGFFWAPISFLAFVWAFYRLPELKDRSYFEIDILFSRKIPARKFKSTAVDVASEQHMSEVK